jgi:hypothetical protein
MGKFYDGRYWPIALDSVPECHMSMLKILLV